MSHKFRKWFILFTFFAFLSAVRNGDLLILLETKTLIVPITQTSAEVFPVAPRLAANLTDRSVHLGNPLSDQVLSDPPP